MKKTVLGAILGVFMLSGAASAATMGPVSCTTVGFSNTELAGALVCPQFNVANAVLTSMTITFTGDIDGTVGLTNNTQQVQSGTAETNSRFTFGPLSGFALPAPMFTVIASTGQVSLNPGETKTMSVTGTQVATYSNTADFVPYVGAGTFNVNVGTQTFLLLSFGGGNVGASQLTQARAAAEVSYEYRELSTVPEPTTLALLGTGLLGATIRRRRK